MHQRWAAGAAIVVFLIAGAASVATGPPYTYAKTSTDVPAVSLGPGVSLDVHRLKICGGKPYVAKRDFLSWRKDYEDSSVQLTAALESSSVSASPSPVTVTISGHAAPDVTRTVQAAAQARLSHKLKLEWAGGDSWCDEVDVTFAQDPTAAVEQTVVWTAKADVFMTIEERPVAYMDVLE